MRLSTSVARRYAEALLNIALQQLKADEYAKKLEDLKELFKLESMRDFIMNPSVEKDEKIEVLCSFLDNVDETFKNFLDVLIVKRRVNYVPLIADYFRQFLNEKEKRMKVKIISAKKIGIEEIRMLKSSLRKLKGEEIEYDLNINVDPNLIGGVMILLEDEMIDLSMKGELERMKNELFSS